MVRVYKHAEPHSGANMLHSSCIDSILMLERGKSVRCIYCTVTFFMIHDVNEIYELQNKTWCNHDVR